MSTTWNSNLVVNLYTNAQGVQRVDFGTLALVSEDATFPETHRVYASPQAVENDSFLSADLKDATDFFFQQPRHQKQITIVKGSYTDYDTTVSAAVAAMSVVPYMWVTDDRTDANGPDLVDWATTNEKCCFIQSSTPATASGTGVFDTFAAADEPRVFPIYHHDDDEHLDLGVAAYWGADNPDNTSTIAGYRTIVGCTANGEAFTDTEKAALEADNANIYLSFYGNNVIYPGTMADGGWADELVIKDWFKTRVGEEIAQELVDAVAAGSKIPLDPGGIKRLEACVRRVAAKGYRVGHFVQDSLVLNSKDYSDYSSSDLQAREAEISATVTLSGAAQTVTINLGVVYRQ